MKRTKLIVASTMLIASFAASDAWSRGGGAGAARGGGRAPARAPSRPSAASRAPSMSRATAQRPAAQRPAVNRPAATRPAVSRPSVQQPLANRPSVSPGRGNAVGNRPNVSRPDTGIASRPNVSRPNAGGGNRPGISGRPSAGDLGSFLDLPGANRPTTLPGNAGRPGAADRPNLADRPNVGNRPNIGDRVNVGDVNINAGNRININRQDNINSIRNHWSNVDRRPFDRDWWGRYPATLPGWRWHGNWGRYPAGWCWRPATWAAYGTWFAWRWASPITYDYGTTVVYRDNNVYANGQQIASADAYYQQAETIADSTPQDVNAEQVEWMPLGVFAITEENATDSGMLVQLAVSKEGIIAGTFYNDITDSGRPLEGMVDRESQRAAWRFADDKNPEVVMETGIYNLTQDEATALVHFGAEKTQTWLMVRLPAPEDEG